MAIIENASALGGPRRRRRPEWNDAFRRRSDLGAAVFAVTAPHRGPVLGWARRQDVPTASRRPVHAPSIEAWAVLDGGITYLYGYGLTSLPSGVHIVGFQAFRLLVAELDLDGPAEPFPGESVVDAGELRRRHRCGADRDAAAVEQAELLGACNDAVLLRWVAATLLAESSAPNAGPR